MDIRSCLKQTSFEYISLLKIAHQVAILSISTVPHQGLNNGNDSIK